MRSAVLLHVFNRPATTQQVFEAIATARPRRLYVSADGPRPGSATDAALCAATRQIVSRVDWDCELRLRFLESNAGCKAAVGGAIDWFFGNEEEGIILEDDTLPEPGFFEYCDELLERFRDDERIGAIGGNNPAPGASPPGDSYFFSGFCFIWGWATWRRAWRRYDPRMAAWQEWERAGGLHERFGSLLDRATWFERLEAAHAGKLQSWAIPWTFSLWHSGMANVVPGRNHVANIGFGADATHTRAIPAFVRDSPPAPVDFPLVHPALVAVDARADAILQRIVFRPGWRRRIDAVARYLARGAWRFHR